MCRSVFLIQSDSSRSVLMNHDTGDVLDNGSTALFVCNPIYQPSVIIVQILNRSERQQLK